jgi:hypothetical protein
MMSLWRNRDGMPSAGPPGPMDWNHDEMRLRDPPRAAAARSPGQVYRCDRCAKGNVRFGYRALHITDMALCLDCHYSLTLLPKESVLLLRYFGHGAVWEEFKPR